MSEAVSFLREFYTQIRATFSPSHDFEIDRSSRFLSLMMSASAANSAILVQNDLETEDFSVVHFERCFQISSLRALFGHLTIFGVSGTGTENIFMSVYGPV